MSNRARNSPHAEALETADLEGATVLILQCRFLEIIDDIEFQVVRHHKEVLAFLQAEREQIKDLAAQALMDLDGKQTS